MQIGGWGGGVHLERPSWLFQLGFRFSNAQLGWRRGAKRGTFDLNRGLADSASASKNGSNFEIYRSSSLHPFVLWKCVDSRVRPPAYSASVKIWIENDGTELFTQGQSPGNTLSGNLAPTNASRVAIARAEILPKSFSMHVLLRAVLHDVRHKHKIAPHLLWRACLWRCLGRAALGTKCRPGTTSLLSKVSLNLTYLIGFQ